MKTKIKLTKEQFEHLEPLVERTQIAYTAFRDAAKMRRDAGLDLWEAIHREHPTATGITHPPEHDWHIVIDDAETT